MSPAPEVLRPSPGRAATLAATRDLLGSGKVLVLDDDPTGSQSMADVPLLLRLGADDVAWALDSPSECVFVLTNSRALDEAEAVNVSRRAAAAFAEAARPRGVQLHLISRSDSTLRGHFPAEVHPASGAILPAGVVPDAILLCPAFPEAGRRTVDGIHLVDVGGRATPVAETEFARDPVFGFSTSDLRAWAAERAGLWYGEIGHIALTDLRRGGPDLVAARLAGPRLPPIVVLDAETSGDLEALALGIARAEAAGRRLVVRSGPSFVAARVGRRVAEALPRVPREPGPGLVMVGSHTATTSQQLQVALGEHRLEVVELRVDEVAEGGARARRAADRCAARADQALRAGSVAVMTSRSEVQAGGGAAAIRLKTNIADALTSVAVRVSAERALGFLIAKGGRTSHDIALGLGAGRVRVLGPVMDGRISVWRLEDGNQPRLPFIVFPGNVGDSGTLAHCLDRLSVV